MQKNAIITGASGGIGGAIAVELAKAGYTLVLLGNRSSDKLEDIKEKCLTHGATVKIITGNLGDPLVAEQLLSEAIQFLNQKVDLLVNAAGISYVGLVTDMRDEDWQTILSTNLSSVFYSCRKVIPCMVHEKQGRIINISSVWGKSGASCEAAYSATKGGLDSFTKSLAKELAPSNIAVNALACGMIDTPMNSCFSEEDIAAICEEIPAGRMGTPEEVANMVLLLAEAPVYLTGQIVTFDGGWQ